MNNIEQNPQGDTPKANPNDANSLSWSDWCLFVKLCGDNDPNAMYQGLVNGNKGWGSLGIDVTFSFGGVWSTDRQIANNLMKSGATTTNLSDGYTRRNDGTICYANGNPVRLCLNDAEMNELGLKVIEVFSASMVTGIGTLAITRSPWEATKAWFSSITGGITESLLSNEKDNIGDKVAKGAIGGGVGGIFSGLAETALEASATEGIGMKDLARNVAKDTIIGTASGAVGVLIKEYFIAPLVNSIFPDKTVNKFYNE